ncbi:unnamed protein product [Prunus brigantina]
MHAPFFFFFFFFIRLHLQGNTTSILLTSFPFSKK